MLLEPKAPHARCAAAMRQSEGAGMAFFALAALLREPKVVPADVFGLLVHARSRGR